MTWPKDGQIRGPVTIDALIREAYATSVEKGWHEGDESPPSTVRIIAWLGLIMSEASEAIEDAREGRLALTVSESSKPEGLPSELADVLIRIGDMCGALNIDLDAAVRAKLAYNRTRHRHGGKRA